MIEFDVTAVYMGPDWSWQPASQPDEQVETVTTIVKAKHARSAKILATKWFNSEQNDEIRSKIGRSKWNRDWGEIMELSRLVYYQEFTCGRLWVKPPHSQDQISYHE